MNVGLELLVASRTQVRNLSSFGNGRRRRAGAGQPAE